MQLLQMDNGAPPTRSERVTFALEGNRLRHQSRNSALQAFVGAKSHFPSVAKTVGFGLGRSKMLYLSMGVD